MWQAKYFYKYRTLTDWAKGVTAKSLLDIGDLLNNSSMIDKGIEIGEHLIAKYVSDERRGRVELRFRGFIYEREFES
jgi:hypothetical protein